MDKKLIIFSLMTSILLFSLLGLSSGSDQCEYGVEIGDKCGGGYVFHIEGEGDDDIWIAEDLHPDPIVNWYNTKFHCGNLENEGYRDWFTPNIDELGIMCEDLYNKEYGDLQDSYYWSSTEHSSQNNRALRIAMDDECQFDSKKKSSSQRVRCIRSDSYSDLHLTTDINLWGSGEINIDSEQDEYRPLDEVTLTAEAEEGYNFMEWSGDCSGTSNTCTLTMDSHKSVTANFESEPIDPDRCQDSSQTIMRLSHETNAHGEVWDGNSDYPIEICYNEIFGVWGLGDHQGNTILWLSDNTDAHASIDQSSEYNVPVRYGDLECSLKNSCEGDERCVVALSGETNAHIEGCDEGNYGNKLCCTGLRLERAYWQDLTGNLIDEASINDKVQLVVEGVGFEDEEFNFEVIEKGGGIFARDRRIAETSSVGYTRMRMDKEGEYYFTATLVDDEDISFDSRDVEGPNGILEVKEPEDSTSPSAEILNPNENDKFKVGTEISFEQTSYDPDDPIKITWDFGDGESKTRKNCQINNCNVTYAYSEGGRKRVTMTVKEMGRDKEIVKDVGISIYDEGMDLYPIISKPESRLFEGRSVEFSANESYIANCTTYSCPAGESCYDVEDLECYQLDKDKIGEEYDFWFEWQFFSEGMGDIDVKKGSWNESYYEVVEFTKSFPSFGEHFAQLRLGLEEF